jgi:hypothetical protein
MFGLRRRSMCPPALLFSRHATEARGLRLSSEGEAGPAIAKTIQVEPAHVNLSPVFNFVVIIGILNRVRIWIVVDKPQIMYNHLPAASGRTRGSVRKPGLPSGRAKWKAC